MASSIKDVLTQGFHPGTGIGEKFIPTLGFLSSSAPPPPPPPGLQGGGGGANLGGGKIRIYSKKRLKRPFTVRFH